MTYQDELATVAEATSARVLAAMAAYVAGNLTLDALVAVVVAFIQAGSLAGASLADLSLASLLTTMTRTPVAPIGVGPGDHALDAHRLEKATRTILADLDQQATGEIPQSLTKAQNRFLRLAESEIKEAAARAYSAAIADTEIVTGWIRGIDADACQLCRWWWREGRVWDADHQMPTHQGCTCNPIPVVKGTAA